MARLKNTAWLTKMLTLHTINIAPLLQVKEVKQLKLAMLPQLSNQSLVRRLRLSLDGELTMVTLLKVEEVMVGRLVSMVVDTMGLTLVVKLVKQSKLRTEEQSLELDGHATVVVTKLKYTTRQ